MKRVFAYLLAIAVIGGMGSRLVDCDPCETTHAPELAGHDHEHDCCPPPPPCEVSCELPCEPDHDEQCPSEHHHHHMGCSHVMPLVADMHSRISFNSSACSRVLLSFEDACAPETPVYEMDKPPLI